MPVVVVESPAKAKTIEKYLGDDFTVLASYGHVSDLPPKDGSVLPDRDFEMIYETSEKAHKPLKAIAQALKGGGNLVLATDPDREGEAISWHVLNWLKEGGKLDGRSVQRVVFHEITRDAVRDAMAHPRDIDMDLVNAQQARRALDYLVGFNLSPVLWRKLPGSRSAGRVQSVALRLICARETEIEAFNPQEYWTVEADFLKVEGAKLVARLTQLDGTKLDKFALGKGDTAHAAARRVREGAFTVKSVERKQVKRNPQPPFITSTLQQEASRKLGFAARRTMQIAQKLYEGIDIGGETTGLITYMRTDSVNLSQTALDSARSLIRERFGDRYLPEKPRSFRSSTRNAQEAHEAIRPTGFERTPNEMARHLDSDSARLYELIWKRALASQMEQALLDQVGVDIATQRSDVVLRATGSVVAFDGFMRLYREDFDEPSDEDDASDRRLPDVKEGEPLKVGEVRPDQHFTEPPPRYTAASLVKRMEELGIGRPSTYAAIIGVLQDRDYVVLDKKRFVPQERGRLVIAFLEAFFPRYVEYTFTAGLEEELDRVSNGDVDWKEVLRAFWKAFHQAVEEAGVLERPQVLEAIEKTLSDHIFPKGKDGVDVRKCPTCAAGRLSLKLGKFGAFIGCSNYPECRYTRQLIAGDDDGVDEGPRLIGQDPENGLPVTLRRGPYGTYLQKGEAGEDKKVKPQRVTVPKGTPPDSIDLDTALRLLSLPREIGVHPEDGQTILAGIGRFGPYLKIGPKYVSLPKDDDVLTIGLNRAVVVIAENAAKGGGRGGSEPLKVLGEHPADKKTVDIRKGRYGPYVAHGRTYASLPKGVEPEDLTMEQALELLAKKSGKKAPAKKAAAEKAPARKATAKKAPAKKKAAKKKTAKKPAKKAPAPKKADAKGNPADADAPEEA
ncbi:MAG: type I DNA topoisomerase [Proteobacteria bacterium]|nr:type I DNA topoisomerase [Pseudomonadota bacterium]